MKFDENLTCEENFFATEIFSKSTKLYIFRFQKTKTKEHTDGTKSQ